MTKVRQSSQVNPVVEVGEVVQGQLMTGKRIWVHGVVVGREFRKEKLISIDIEDTRLKSGCVPRERISCVRWRRAKAPDLSSTPLLTLDEGINTNKEKTTA